MPQEVDVPGVGRLQFPDAMSQTDMAAAIQKNFPQVGKPTRGDVRPFIERMGTGERLARGFAAGAQSVGHGIKQAAVDLASKFNTLSPDEQQIATETRQQSGGPGADLSDILRRETDSARKQNAPLLQTTAGRIGNFAGEAAAAAPSLLIPGAETLPGAVAVGALTGAAQPVGSKDSRVENTLWGAVGGAAGQKAGQALGWGVGKIADKVAPVAKQFVQAAGVSPEAANAVSQGYRLPPSMAKAKPSLLDNITEGVGGKVRSEQAFSIPNQANTNRLVRDSLGLHPGDKVSLQEVLQTRRDAGDAYKAVRDIPGVMRPTQTYTQALDTIDNTFKNYSKKFPNLFRNDEVQALVQDLRQPLSPDEAVQISMKLREDATANYRATTASDKALGRAQKKAADAVDELIEEHLSKAPGMSDLYQSYRKARQIIARTYDVQKVLNDRTGNVDAIALAKLSNKRPLSGELKDIADFGSRFEGAARVPTSKGSRLGPEFSKSELGVAALAAMSGNHHAAVKAAAIPLASSGARKLLLSDMYQRTLGPQAISGNPVADETAKRLGALAGANTLQDDPQRPQR